MHRSKQIAEGMMESILSSMKDKLSKVTWWVNLRNYLQTLFPDNYDIFTCMYPDVLCTIINDFCKRMDEPTRKRALEKLSKFRTEVGFPDVWEDNSGAQLSDRNLASSILGIYRYVNKNAMDQIDGKPDLNAW